MRCSVLLLMSRDRDRDEGGFLQSLGVVLVLLLGFLLQPGLLLVYATRQLFELDVDKGQLWSFGAATSFALYATLAMLKQSWWGALGSYAFLCLAASAFWGLSHWGFHARWPAELWNLLFG